MQTLVILPTYNEHDNLPIVVNALLTLPDVRVLVVDDQSPDGTGVLAETLAQARPDRIEVMHRRGPRGLGRSYVDGMVRALETDAALICQMDADLSHDPADVPRLMAQAPAADLVIGSRYVSGGRVENWPRRRVLLSAFANRYVRAITGLAARDCTSGFRCWRREALQRIALRDVASNGYAFLVEMAWLAARAGCRIVEVPITFTERRAGASKLSRGVIVESAIVPWRLKARGRG
jgi:dolichol-phosphate mannosyltransferase